MRHDCIQRRLGISTLFRPDPMSPINCFDRSLIRHALGESQSSSRRMRRSGLSCRSKQSQQCHGQKRNHVKGASANTRANWRINALSHACQLLFTFSLETANRWPTTAFTKTRGNTSNSKMDRALERSKSFSSMSVITDDQKFSECEYWERTYPDLLLTRSSVTARTCACHCRRVLIQRSNI